MKANVEKLTELADRVLALEAERKQLLEQISLLQQRTADAEMQFELTIEIARRSVTIAREAMELASLFGARNKPDGG